MLKNIINTFFTRSAASIIGLFIAIIISHVYGAEVRGEQGLILTTITVIVLLTAIIGAGSITYFVPREKVLNLLIPSTIWNIIICFIVYFVLVRTHILSAELNMHICYLSLILTQSQIHTGILLGYEKIKESNYISLTNTLGIFVLLLFLVFVIKISTIDAYIYSLYFGYGISLILSCFYMSNIKYGSITGINKLLIDSLNGLKSLFRYGILNQLDNVAQILSFRLSYYLIDYYLSKRAVGIYSNAISIIESIWLISRSILTVQNARIVNSNDINYSIRISVEFIRISFVLVFFAIIVLLFIPANFYQFLFGNEFAEVKMVVVSISPGILFFSTAFILNGLFSGTGDFLYNAISSIVSLIITIVFGILLIPKMGLIGAGLTGSLSYTANSVVKIIFFELKYKVPLRQLLPGKEDIKKAIQILRMLR